ncbi:MAG: TetR/AcrR family transcriptional regulator [Nannocystaceae bacterium]|nr:TetR/AcrR family transcriptional regulator [Nannocystaceae bacterium]
MNHDSLFARFMVYRATPKTQARKLVQRELLLEAARGLVAQGGFAATSIQAVAARAGLATGSVYRHFPSKAELFVEVFVEASAHEVQTMAQAAEGHPSATQALRAAVQTWSSRALQGRTLAYALIAEPVMPELETARLRLRQAYVDVLRAILRRGCDTSEFSLPNLDLAAAAIVGAMAEALVGPLSHGDVHDAEARHTLASDLTHFCLQAVTPSASP